jgi:hypothetical protein
VAGSNGAATPASDPRPSIWLTGDLHEQVDRIVTALARTEDPLEPRVLLRGAELVRMTERGELEPLSSDSLLEEMSRAAGFVKLNAQQAPVWVAPPKALASLVLSRDAKDYGSIPRVEHVVDAPVVSAAGSLVSEPGYNRETGIWFRPAPGMGRLEPRDDWDAVRAARDWLLREVLGDFGFVEQADRANALALMLTPTVLPYLGGAPTPLFPILGSEHGVGKSYLAEAALLPACGRVPTTPEVGNPEEWRKNITTQLMAGVTAIWIDNLHRTLDTGPLAAALTSSVWRDRALGRNELVTLPIRNVWVTTAKNLGISPELARRAVPIYLDPGETKPSDRPKAAFRHANLIEWLEQNRALALRALLTLVCGWLGGKEALTLNNDGEWDYERQGVGSWEPVNAPPLGSFDRWQKVVGGILQAADVEGFLGNLGKIRVENVDDDHEQMAVFVYQWAQLRLEPLDVRALSRLCVYGKPLHNHLPDAIDVVDVDEQQKRLGVLLQKYRGQNFSGLRLDHDGGSGAGKRKHWYIRGATEPPDSHPTKVAG